MQPAIILDVSLFVAELARTNSPKAIARKRRETFGAVGSTIEGSKFYRAYCRECEEPMRCAQREACERATCDACLIAMGYEPLVHQIEMASLKRLSTRTLRPNSLDFEDDEWCPWGQVAA